MKVLTKRRTPVLMGTNSSRPLVRNVYSVSLFFFVFIFLISFVSSASTYSDCSVYGNCVKSSTGTTYTNTTYQNNTYNNITNNYNADLINVMFKNETNVPTSDGSFNLGSLLYRWFTGFFVNLDVSGNITTDYINHVGFRNITTMGDTVVWEIELDN